MTGSRPLFWHQGLFLQPHHFQQMDLYYHSLLTPYHQFLQPHLWGVDSLKIQNSALANRSFSLTEGEFLFPDGTHVVFPGNSLLKPRSFEADWVEGDKTLGVFLGLRCLNEFGQNVTVIPGLETFGDVTTRFASMTDSEQIADLHQHGPEAPLRKLFYVLKVFWESETDQLGDYLLIPVARLQRSGENITASEQFVPPSLTISGSTVLSKLVREIRDQIASRGNQLESYKRERGIHTAEFGSRDMVYLLALRSLNRYASLLFHLTETGRVHPWGIYGVVSQMIGELSSFSEEIRVTGETAQGEKLLPRYNHRDLWGCFSSAAALVSRLLDEITAGPEYVLPLLFDGTYFGADLTQAMFEGRNRYYLVFETEEDSQSVLQSLDNISKISARETLPILIARALPGIKIQSLQIPPQELPRRARALYYQIDHHSDQWAHVEKNRNLALYWDSAPEDLKVELMIVGRT
jgi:type VI secretion system protein ImpJ